MEYIMIVYGVFVVVFMVTIVVLLRSQQTEIDNFKKDFMEVWKEFAGVHQTENRIKQQLKKLEPKKTKKPLTK